MVRKFKKYLVQEKRESSSQKKATAKGKKSAMMIPTHPPLDDQRRRSCSESDVIVKRAGQELKEQQKQSPEKATFRNRSQTMPCSSYFEDGAATMKDRALTENAKDLSPERLLALELDIFKPLDFYEILFHKMKSEGNAKAD